MFIRDRFLIVPELIIHVLGAWRQSHGVTVSTRTVKSRLVAAGHHGQIASTNNYCHATESFILSLFSIIRHGLAKFFRTRKITRFYLFMYICLV